MKKQQTALQVAIRNAGFRKAHQAFLWIFMWGMTREELRREPTPEEVGLDFDLAISQAFRHQQAYRHCFPGTSPADFYAANPEAVGVCRKLNRVSEEYRAAVEESSARSNGKRKVTALLDTALLSFGFMAAP
jgi:hypothetical protein